jgi:hypothetical protein
MAQHEANDIACSCPYQSVFYTVDSGEKYPDNAMM